MSSPDDQESYWQSLEGLASRVGMVAQNFIYTAYNAAVAWLRGSQDKISQVEWILGPNPCEICQSYAGIYDPEMDLPDIPGEVHPNCNCWLALAS